jgi:UDP-2,3-diacylglucosamine pyrophosphatase LpxH
MKKFMAIILVLFGFSSFPTTAASNLIGFQTPSKNIHCAGFVDASGTSLRCDILQNNAKIPARPKDCQLDYGNAFEMTLKGKSLRLCHGDTVADAYPILKYGTTWKWAGFVCNSSTAGVRCTNLSGHGWQINKSSQTLF